MDIKKQKPGDWGSFSDPPMLGKNKNKKPRDKGSSLGRIGCLPLSNCSRQAYKN